MKYDLRFLHALVEAQKLAEASNFKHTARALERMLRDEELRAFQARQLIRDGLWHEPSL